MTTAVSYKSELVGVFGHPIAENPTVVPFTAAFRERRIDWRYLTVDVRPEDLADAMRGMRAMNFAGIHLTIPHKVAVIQHLDSISPEAELMGAVNTVVREKDQLIGYNTDGVGFLRSVTDDAGVDPKGKSVVFLGAGGAARAMTVQLALAGAARITVVNRSPRRGQDLVALLGERTPAQAHYEEWKGEYAVPAGVDILVNATSIGLFPHVEEMPPVDMATIRPDLLVCDVIPNPPQTAFLRAAEACGARTLDGLGMLAYGGAQGFELWTGIDAPVDVMRSALEALFKG